MLADSEKYLERYIDYLRLERGLAENTLSAYSVDIGHLLTFLRDSGLMLEDVAEADLQQFLATLKDLGIQPRSQARMLAAIRSFFRYLVMEKVMESDPTALIENPRIGIHLPDVLTLEEIDDMLLCIDDSKEEAPRNRAIIEMLYGSGLRVSELTALKISRFNFADHYVIVEGKGSKQRIVPVSEAAEDAINEYMDWRSSLNIKKGCDDILFLNRRGGAISRVMVFYIVKDLAERAGITHKVSPHTLRHSFATHLIEGGANLRVVQEMLGHELISTTEIYVHIDRTHLRTELMAHHPHYK